MNSNGKMRIIKKRGRHMGSKTLLMQNLSSSHYLSELHNHQRPFDIYAPATVLLPGFFCPYASLSSCSYSLPG